jgi:hypothetical protein
MLNYSEILYIAVKHYKTFKNSLIIILKEKTKEITTVSVVLYVIKDHVHLHKLKL